MTGTSPGTGHGQRKPEAFDEVPLRLPLQLVRHHWETTTGLTSEQSQALFDKLRELSVRTEQRSLQDQDRLTNLK